MLSLQIFTSLGVYSALSLHLRRITSLNFCPPETHCGDNVYVSVDGMLFEGGKSSAVSQFVLGFVI